VSKSLHPFADLIGLTITALQSGESSAELCVTQDHLNPHGVVHGAVLYALADTGMGAAVHSTLSDGEICATIQITMNYFAAVREGSLRCDTVIMNRGKSVANLRSQVFLGDRLVASADGNFAIFKPNQQ